MSTYTTLATDVLALAALAAKDAPFKNSLGTEGDDDSLCAPRVPDVPTKTHSPT